MKALLVSFCCLAQDEECQKLGVVGIVWNTGPNRVNDPYSAWKVSSACTFLPIRLVSLHYCYDSPILSAMIDMTMLMTGKETRLRFRSHNGKFLGRNVPCISFDGSTYSYTTLHLSVTKGRNQNVSINL